MEAKISSVILLVLFVWCSCCYSSNLRPIIGILTQPTDGDLAPYGNSYIAASYVKYIEAGGARVVPIFHNLTSSQLTALLSSLNGVFFPGGGADMTGVYLNTVQTIWNYVLKTNENGGYFPMWGTCFGFQEICMLASGNLSLLSSFNSENISLPLNFTSAASSSDLLGQAPQPIQTILKTLPVTMNNHQYGVSPQSWWADKTLPKMFSMLSTNYDRDNLEFVSTIEAYKYPIYASQWHPEKNLFEWNPDEAINHSIEAVLISQYTLDFFVQKARDNSNTFSSATAESNALIYNYQPVYTGTFDFDFVQCYFWNLTNSQY